MMLGPFFVQFGRGRDPLPLYNRGMKPDCLFCKIAAGQMETPIIWENEVAVAFADIHPSAPIHLLIVPRQHIASLNELNDMMLGGQLLLATRDVARQVGLAEKGYRAQINVGRDGGQVINHLHLHLLAGKQFKA